MMKKPYNFQLKLMPMVFMTMVMFLLVAPNALKAQTFEDGTAANPFLIESRQELLDFNACMATNQPFYHDGTTFVTTSDPAYVKIFAGGKLSETAPAYFKLTTDIVVDTGDVAGCGGIMDSHWIQWEPITTFNGHFDGNFHVISGLYGVQTSAEHANGFFAQLSGGAAVVENLGIANSYFAGVKWVGGIAGAVGDGAMVRHCFFEGSLEATGECCGGIVGRLQSGTVTECYSSGSVYGTDYFNGGLVGKIDGGGTLSNCYSSASVQSTGGTTGGAYGWNEGNPIDGVYYDKQMTVHPSAEALARLTSELTDGTLSITGFTSTSDFYPYLTGFDFSKVPVRLSVLPIFIHAVGSVNYETMEQLMTDFTVGYTDGVVWSVSSWNNCATVSGTNVTLRMQGIANLVATLGDYSRTYVIRPYKAPFLGTAENPFTIDNYTDLTNFRKGMNDGVDFYYKRILVPAANFANTHWLQTADIDVSRETNWTPIGKSGTPFTGHYDGGEHRIDNMKITSGEYKAFFGFAQNATFKNLFVSGTVSGSTIVAIFCADIVDGTVTNCGSEGSVTGNGGGGLLGRLRGTTVRVKKCYNKANVTINGHAGGVTGNALVTNCYVEECFNTGNVRGTSWVGGVYGYTDNYNTSNRVEITRCYNTGNVTGTNSNDWCDVGGIVGVPTNNMKVSFCYNYGTIKGGAKTAGIVGYSGGGTVEYCFNAGRIEGVNFTDNNGGEYAVAGISAHGATASYCFNVGEIVTNKAYNVGGITATAIATHCFNAGQIRPGDARYCAGVTAGTAVSKNTINVGQIVDPYSAQRYGYYGNTKGGTVSSSFYDINFTPDVTTGGTRVTTRDLIGENSVAKPVLNTTYWIFEEGMYPRLRWTDSLDWARDIAIAASTPVLLSSDEQNAYNVKDGIKIYGCDSNIIWKVMPLEASQTMGGCLFSGKEPGDTLNGTCVSNAITPTLANVCLGPTTIGAYVGDTLVKQITLRRYIKPVKDTLTVDSIQDLQALQVGINTGEAFYYKDSLIPRFADSTYFLLTTNGIDLSGISNWSPIGNSQALFKGYFLGNDKTITGLKSSSTYAGLFGKVSGHIQDLHLTNVTITGGTYKGAVCAWLYNGKVENCSSDVAISGGSSYAGGIVGYANGTDTITHCVVTGSVSNGDNYTGGIVGRIEGSGLIDSCVNYSTVTCTGSYGRVGGIAGMLSSAVIKHSHNEGAVKGSYRVGGIIGEGSEVYYCYNLGDVTGTAGCEFIGGVGGSTTCYYCYNQAIVTALPGNSTSNHYVGGISGSGNPQYCYNAGIIYGANRKYVGGITGSGNPQYCYNSNTARSTGTQLGSICGTGTPKQCYYDKQMSPAGGINNADVAGKAEGLSTTDMLGMGLKGAAKLGTTAWDFTNSDLYPQLAAFAGTDPSVASVMPVLLQNNETYKSVRSSFYMKGCNVGEWHKLQGSGLNLDTTNNHCQSSVVGVGIVKLAATTGDREYKQVRLLIGISEDAPYVIKNLAQMDTFRRVINQDGFYNMVDSTYHLTLNHQDSVHIDDFAEIQDGGLDLFFKLITDLDFSSLTGSWQPIGDYATNTNWLFQGTFMGMNHTITGLTLSENKNYRGLFGRMNSAEVRDLHITGSQMTGSGEWKGLLCAMNYGGVVKNCSVENSEISCTGKYHSLFCGGNYYGTIKNCHVANSTLTSNHNSGDTRAGGICAHQEYGTIDTCYVDHLTMDVKRGYYNGGILGYDYYGTVRQCYNKDGNMTLADANNYTGAGGIVGYARSTGIRECYTKDTRIYSSNASTVGGIVGEAYYYGHIRDCYTDGGSITSKHDRVGGIVGYVHEWGSNNTTVSNYIIRCHNSAPISGRSEVGGLVGRMYPGNIDSCYNTGNVTATGNDCGGILGLDDNWGRVTHCYNTGDVTATGATSTNTGGIVGRTVNAHAFYVYFNYNLGKVTGVTKVGGIVGQQYHGYISCCYNAGIVTGVSQVGGIMGVQGALNGASSQNYNIAWIYGTSMVGAICGYTPNTGWLSNNFYDSQMSHYAGVNGEDVTGTTPKRTSEMLGSGLQTNLTNANWVFTTGMYPRIKKWANTNAGIASALPVMLPESPTVIHAKDIPAGTYANSLAGCDSVSWVRYDGYGLSIDDCSGFTVTGRNYAQIANKIGDDTLKVVQLVLGISEDNPLEIISLEQFKRFRDLVNSNTTFYYDPDNRVFVNSAEPNFVEIDPCGAGMYFKLVVDIDLSLETEDWVPIGNYDNETRPNIKFMGHFNGGDHTVTGMSITSSTEKRYQGLFGYLQGTVKNLNMERTNITCDGNFHGSICGYNYGTILNCHSILGTVKGSRYIGGLTGKNVYDQIADSYNGNNVSGRVYVGGISGQCETAGVVVRCFNYGIITATGDNSFVGGITGHTNVEISDCYNTGAINGKVYTAGIAGWSETSYLRRCYNAGYVDTTTTSYVGAITTSNNSSYYPYNCYYDLELCHLKGGIGFADGAGDASGRTTKLLTINMTGTGTRSGLGNTGTWVYTDSLYPRLASTETTEGAIVSTKPVFLREQMYIDKIGLPFTAKLGDGVVWDRGETYGRALNLADASTGNIKLTICGADTLRVIKNNHDYRLVPLYVSELAAETVVDTACGGSYYWAPARRTFTASIVTQVMLPVAEGCDSVLRLNLTVPPALEILMESSNRSCYNGDDDYAEATVSGGFGEGYLYYWTNENGDTISRTNRISHPLDSYAPGTYTFYLSVRDAIHTSCEEVTSVTLTKPTELVATITDYDGQCWNHPDGYITLDIAGGISSYTVTYSGASSNTITSVPAGTYTIGPATSNGLADGNYTVRVTDQNGCYVERSCSFEDDDTQYAITAMGVNKMYDGVAVDLNQFVLQIGTGTPDTIAASSYKVLANGDTLRATVSMTETVKNYTTGSQNNVTGYTITKDGVDQTCRYNVTTTNSTVEIWKRNVTLTSATATYDLQDTDDPATVTLTDHNVAVTVDGFATGEGATFNVTGIQVGIGVSPNTYTYTLNDGTLPINYNITQNTGRLIIASHVVIYSLPAQKMYDGIELTHPYYEFAGKLEATDTLLAEVTGAITDAGFVLNTVSNVRFVLKSDLTTLVDPNPYVVDTIIHDTLRVTPRNVTLSTVSDSKMYDGTPLTRPTVTVSGDGFISGQVTSCEAPVSITNAGDSINRIVVHEGTGFLAQNYNIVRNEGHLVVDQRPLVITGETRELAYNGMEQSLTGYSTTTLLPTDTITGLTYLARGTHVNEDPGYAGVFTGTPVIKNKTTNEVMTGNYDWSLEPGKLSITGNDLPLKIISGSHDFAYNGQPHNYRNYTVLYNNAAVTSVVNDTIFTLPTGDKLIIHSTFSGIIHVDDNTAQNNTYLYDLVDIYNNDVSSSYVDVFDSTGTVRITPRQVDVYSENEQIFYNGEYIPTHHADVNVDRVGAELPVFATGEGITCTFNGYRKDVGSSPNSFTWTYNGSTRETDYNIIPHFGTLTVDPAQLTITSVDTFKTYGTVNPSLRYTITGFVNDEDTTVTGGAPFIGTARPTPTTVATTGSPAGQYEIVMDVTGVEFQNYTIVPHNGTLTIRRRVVNLEAYDLAPLTYDGLSHSYAETATPHYEVTGDGLMAGDTVYSVLINGARTVAGVSDITLSNAIIKHKEADNSYTDVTQSYEATYTNGTITIEPRAITLKPMDYYHPFTGHTYNSDSTVSPHYTIVSGTLAPHDSIVGITITGSLSAVDTIPFVITPGSVLIVDTNEVHDYTSVAPALNMTAGYNITLQNGELGVSHRTTDPYEIVLKGIGDTVEYNGTGQGISGWQTTEFTFDGFTYHVVGVTSSIENVTNVGDYTTTISGDPHVLNANNDDVTDEFHVTTQTGNFKITQRPLELTAFGLTTEYDGRTHSAQDILYPYCRFTNGTSLCGGHNIANIELTGERRLPGETPVVITSGSVRINNSASADVTSNYNITLKDSVIKITNRTTPFDLLVRAAHDTVPYNSAVQSVTGFETLTFTVNENTFTVGGLTATGASATDVSINKNSISGTATVTDAWGENVTPQFSVRTKDDTLQITKRAITITADNNTKAYDGTALTDDGWADIAPVPADNDYVASVTVTGTQTNVGSSNNVPSAAVIKRTDTDADVTSNYDITYTNGTLEVTGNTNTISVASATEDDIIYDGELHKKEVYTVKYNGTDVTADATGKVFTLPTGDRLTITPTFAGVTNVADANNVDHNNTFTYTLTNNAFYTGTRDTTFGTVKINQREITVKVDNGPEKVYTGVEQTGVSASDYVFTNVVSGETAAIAYTPAKGTNVGTYMGGYATAFTVTKDATSADVTSNYNLTTKTPDTLKIKAKTLEIAAVAKTYTYNGANQGPEGTYTSGFDTYVTVGELGTGDALNSITLSGSKLNQGTYTNEIEIVAGTVVIKKGDDVVTDNYAITYTPADLTINKKAVTITATAQEYVYNAAPQGEDNATYTSTTDIAAKVTCTDLATGDALNSITLNGQQTAVGEYNTEIEPSAALIKQGETDMTGNYEITYVKGKLTITHKTLTITAKDQEYEYNATSRGENNATYTTATDIANKVTVEGLEGSDALTSIKLDGNETAANVYTEKIVPSDAAVGSNTANYAISYVKGKLTITKAVITITADDKTREYGVVNPEFTYTPSGFKGSDDASVISGTVTYTGAATTADATSAPGDYTITPVVTGLTADNYTFSAADGTLTITNSSKHVTIISPTTSWMYDGVVHTDEEYVVKYGDGTTDVTLAATVVDGHYEYTISGTGDVVTVTPASTAKVTHVAEGDVNNAFAYTVQNAGRYAATVADTGKLSITTRPVELTADDHEFTYDGAEHSYHEYTSTGANDFVTGETYTVNFSDASVISVPAQSTVDNVITGITWDGTAVSTDYAMTYQKGDLTMVFSSTRIPLAIRAIDSTWVYDGATHSYPGYTYSLNGAADIVVPKTDNGTTTLTGGAILHVDFDLISSKITEYVQNGVDNHITGQSVTMNGYDVTGAYEITAVDGTLEISRKEVTITANSNSWPYDGMEHTESGYTVEGLVGSDAIAATTSGSITFPGTATNTIVSANFTTGNANNYSIQTPYGTGTLTITAPTSPWTLTVNPVGGSKEYDGTPLVKDTCDVTINGTTYHVGAAGDVTFQYNGVDHVLHVDIAGSQTEPGTSQDTVRAWSVRHNGTDVSSCFQLATTPANLTVSPVDGVTITIVGNTDVATYDGSAHTVTGYVITDITSSLLHESDITFSGTATATRTNVVEGSDADGKTQMGLADTQFGLTPAATALFANVVFSVEDGYMQIDPKDITVTAVSREFTYDGTTQSDNHYTVTGLVGSDTVGNVVVTGSITYPSDGDVPNVVDITGMTFTTGVATNYSATPANGVLTMVYNTTRISIDITAASHTWEYDAAPHSDPNYSVVVDHATAVEVTNATHTYEIPGSNGDVLTVTVEGQNGNIQNFMQSPMNNIVTGWTIRNNGVDVHENYEVNTYNGTLNITQKAVMVKAHGHTWTYDGNPHSETGYTVTGLIAGDATLEATTSGSITFPGEESNIISSTNFTSGIGSNYAVTKDTGTLRVELPATPIALRIVADSYEGVYDGQTHTAPTFTVYQTVGGTEVLMGSATSGNGVTLDNGHDIVRVTVTGSIRDYIATGVNNVPAVVSIKNGSTDVLDVYNPTLENGLLKLNQRPLQIQAASGTWTYDGVAHTKNSSSDYSIVNGTSLATGDALESVTLTGSQTFEGSSDNVASAAVIKRGETNVTGNYNVQYLNGTLTVNANMGAIVVTSGNYEAKYDGNSHYVHSYTVTFNGLNCAAVEGSTTQFLIPVSSTKNDTLTVTPGTAEVKHVDDGTVNNTFTCSLTNSTSYQYAPSTTSGTLKVNPREITMTSESATKLYDGTPLTRPTVAVTGDAIINGEIYDIEATGSVTTIAEGEVTNTITFNTTSDYRATNYTITKVEGALQITGTDDPITITSADGEWTYDGEEHSKDIYTVVFGSNTVTADATGLKFELLSGDTLRITPSTSRLITNAGTKANTYTYTIDNEGAYVGTKTANEGTLTVNPAAVTVKAVDNGKVYGESDPATLTATVSGMVHSEPESLITYTVSRATGENVGHYTITPSGYAVQGNYAVAYETGDFEITPKAITIAADEKTKVYDNDATTDPELTAIVTGVPASGVAPVYSLSRVSGQDVGKYVITVSAEATANPNYTVTVEPDTFRITPQAITIAAEFKTKMYDNDPSTDPELTATITGVPTNGVAPVYSLSREVGQDAADYTITVTASATANPNYTVTTETNIFRITKRTGVVVTIHEHGKEVVYNNATQSVTGYDVSINDPLGIYAVADFTFTGPTEDTTASGTGSADALHYYPMPLHLNYFRNDNTNYTDVSFIGVDSGLYIYPVMKASAVTVGITCNENNGGEHNDGKVTITVTGGRQKHDGMYGFAIDGGAPADDNSPKVFEGLAKGAHTVEVTDSIGTTFELHFTINEPDEMTAVVSVPTDHCPNHGSYQVSVSVENGVENYSYVWSGHATDANANITTVDQIGTNDGEQEYDVTVVVTDHNSCKVTATGSFTVRPSVKKPTSITYTCANDTIVTLRYGAVDTAIVLNQPTYATHFSLPMSVELLADGLRTRYAVPEGLEDTTYIVTWKVTDECGADTVICTQRVTVKYPTCGPVTDGGGFSYFAVRLGGNCWTASNMMITPTPLGRAVSYNGAYKYNDSDELYQKFGYLYTWYAACRVPEGSSDVPAAADDYGHIQGICPDDWALPTAEDYIYMVEAIGGVPHMKIADNTYWIDGLQGTAPSSGFDAKGAGYYKSSTGSFESLMAVTRFWTASLTGSTDTGTAIQCAVCEGEEVIIAPKADGYSIRCVRIR